MWIDELYGALVKLQADFNSKKDEQDNKNNEEKPDPLLADFIDNKWHKKVTEFDEIYGINSVHAFKSQGFGKGLKQQIEQVKKFKDEFERFQENIKLSGNNGTGKLAISNYLIGVQASLDDDAKSWLKERISNLEKNIAGIPGTDVDARTNYERDEKAKISELLLRKMIPASLRNNEKGVNRESGIKLDESTIEEAKKFVGVKQKEIADRIEASKGKEEGGGKLSPEEIKKLQQLEDYLKKSPDDVKAQAMKAAAYEAFEASLNAIVSKNKTAAQIRSEEALKVYVLNRLMDFDGNLTAKDLEKAVRDGIDDFQTGRHSVPKSVPKLEEESAGSTRIIEIPQSPENAASTGKSTVEYDKTMRAHLNSIMNDLQIIGVTIEEIRNKPAFLQMPKDIQMSISKTLVELDGLSKSSLSEPEQNVKHYDLLYKFRTNTLDSFEKRSLDIPPEHAISGEEKRGSLDFAPLQREPAILRERAEPSLAPAAESTQRTGVAAEPYYSLVANHPIVKRNRDTNIWLDHSEVDAITKDLLKKLGKPEQKEEEIDDFLIVSVTPQNNTELDLKSFKDARDKDKDEDKDKKDKGYNKTVSRMVNTGAHWVGFTLIHDDKNPNKVFVLYNDSLSDRYISDSILRGIRKEYKEVEVIETCKTLPENLKQGGKEIQTGHLQKDRHKCGVHAALRVVGNMMAPVPELRRILQQNISEDQKVAAVNRLVYSTEEQLLRQMPNSLEQEPRRELSQKPPVVEPPQKPPVVEPPQKLSEEDLAAILKAKVLAMTARIMGLLPLESVRRNNPTLEPKASKMHSHASTVERPCGAEVKNTMPLAVNHGIC